MNLKRSFAIAITSGLIGISSVPAAAKTPGKEIKINQENFEKLSAAEQQRVLEIKDRLETIHAIDRSSLTKDERVELRSEMKELKEEVRSINARGPVIYISASALLIIILLIILL